MLHCTRCAVKALSILIKLEPWVQGLQMSVGCALEAFANSIVVMPLSFFSLSISKRFRSTAIFVEAKRAGYKSSGQQDSYLTPGSKSAYLGPANLLDGFAG